jgi:DNA polymerase I-like protein with 3'-5' exonuclease and polymerase domains
MKPVLLTAIDLETFSFGPGNMAPRIVSVGSLGSDGNCLVELPTVRVLRRLLRSPATLVGLFIAYDMLCAVNQFPELLPLVAIRYGNGTLVDLGMLHAVRSLALRGNPEELSLLKLHPLHCPTSEVVLDKSEDSWRLRYAELSETPIQQWPVKALQYAKDDVRATHEVGLELRKKLPDSLWDEAARQSRHSFWLHAMSSWGMRLDQERVKQLLAKLDLQQEETVDRLKLQGLLSVTKKGTIHRHLKRAQELVEGLCPEIDRTPTGKPKLDAVTLEKFQLEELKDYQRYSELEKKIALLRSWSRLGDNPLHPRFSLKSTGRTGSSPNVQNLPREGGFRECFVPRPGNVLLAADYASLELHTLAQACLDLLGRSKLAESLNKGVDLHLQVAAQILSRPAEELDLADPEVKKARQVAKDLNYGLPGGMGVERLAKSLGASFRRAAELKKAWHRAWPEMEEYFTVVRKAIDPSGSYSVRQLRTSRIRAGCSYTAACNTYFQGLAADGAKEAGWLLFRACYDRTFEDWQMPYARTYNFVHDEFLVECPAELAEGYAPMLSQIMAVGMNQFVPDVPVSLPETKIMERWSK